MTERGAFDRLGLVQSHWSISKVECVIEMSNNYLDSEILFIDSGRKATDTFPLVVEFSFLRKNTIGDFYHQRGRKNK
jgi:hypothetical protein